MLKMPSHETRQLKACARLWAALSASCRSCVVPGRSRGSRTGTEWCPATGPTVLTQLHLPRTARLRPMSAALKHSRMLQRRRVVLSIGAQTAVGNSSCLILYKKRRWWEIPVLPLQTHRSATNSVCLEYFGIAVEWYVWADCCGSLLAL